MYTKYQTVKFHYIYSLIYFKQIINVFMRILKYLYIVFGFLWILSCNSNTRQVESDSEKQNEDTKTITLKDIDNLRFTDYILSGDSKKVVIDWEKYQELNSQTDFLKRGDLSFFRNKKDTLKTFLSGFKKEVPKSINTNIVQSRITVLETNILKLNSVLHLGNIPKTEQLNNIKAYLMAMANLNLHINKKLELDAHNIQKPF
jgi:hypothetical protein